jgi:WD40 repeat protein/serine/threonine protein kinase
MKPAESKRALEILDNAHGLSESELEAYLDRVCGSDSVLRREVLSFLDYDDKRTVLPAGVANRRVPEIPLATPSETRYDLGDEIARGGMGVVLRAFDNNIRRNVAVKVLRSDIASHPEIVGRFLQEAQISGQLQHPGIAPVYEIGRLPDGRPFIAMKLVQGATLEALLAERRDVADGQARFLSIFEQVCQVIAFAHRRGVIHRDLKPSNVMVGKFGEVQVMDWGIAKIVGDNQDSGPFVADAGAGRESKGSRAGETAEEDVSPNVDTDHTAIRTRIGQMMGTPSYMAPEQVFGRADSTTDVFALGGILCEILTGTPPYQASSSTERLDQAKEGEIHQARDRLRACAADQELIQLAIECLDPDIDKRPCEASHVERRITAYLESVQERARQAEIARAKAQLMAVEQRRRFRHIVAAMGVGTALVLGGILFFQHLRNRHADEILNVEKREREQAEVLGYWSIIQAAFGAYETSQHHDAYDMLQQAPTHLRDWEWHYLNSQIDNSSWHYRLPGEHVHATLFQDDGRKIALITDTGVIKIIDRETKKLAHEPTETNGQPVAINAGGTHLLVRRPKTYDLWEIASGRLVRSFPSYASSVSPDAPPLKFKYPTEDRYAISPDGARVAVVGTVDYKTIHLYKVTEKEPVHSFVCAWGNGCGFSDDGNWFIYSNGGKVHFWDLTANQAARPPIEVQKAKRPKVNRDGTFLAAEEFSRLKAWHLASDQPKSLAQTPFENFTFDVSGRQLLVANPNASLQIWDPQTGELSRPFGFTHANVSRIGDYSWHGSEVVVASTRDGAGQIRIWRQEQPESMVLEGHTNDIYPVAMSRDGSVIASGSWDGTARIWDGESGRQLFKLTHPMDVQALALAPDGRRLVTVTQDREMRLWDASTGQLMVTKRHYDGFDFNPDILFSSDGTTILCTSKNRIHRLNANTLEIDHMLDQFRIDDIATDAAESLIASISFSVADATFSMSLRDPESFHELRSIQLPSEPVAVAISSQGGLVAVGFKDGSVGVWETRDLQNLWLTTSHGGEVFDVLFEPDGSRLFSAGRDGRIKIWDPHNGKEYGELSGHHDYIMSLAISADGTRLVSGSGDDTVRLWDSKRRRGGRNKP